MAHKNYKEDHKKLQKDRQTDIRTYNIKHTKKEITKYEIHAWQAYYYYECQHYYQVWPVHYVAQS